MNICLNTRLRHIREREILSSRAVARRLNIDTPSYERLETPGHTLTVAELWACCQAMEIPVSEFFGEGQDVPLLANVLRAYKSAMTLKSMRLSSAAEVIVERLIADLLKINPNMDGHTYAQPSGNQAWPVTGKRRTKDEISPREEFPICTQAFASTPIPEFAN